MGVKVASIIEMKSGNITVIMSTSRALRMVCRLEAYQGAKAEKRKEKGTSPPSTARQACANRG